LILIWEAMNY